MHARFWGVRGSVPYGTAASMRHGCNTACVEVTDDRSKQRLIIDAGSGIVGLGDTMTGGGRVSILLTHYHWDHIQGLPYFAPLYSADYHVTLWAPALDGSGEHLRTLFDQPFFPVGFQELGSRPEIRMVTPGDFRIDGFDISALPLNHPGGAFAYRVRGGRDLVCATDHEFGQAAIDNPFAEFARGAGAIVLDAHYTPEELPQFKGWGHGDWSECAQ